MVEEVLVIRMQSRDGVCVGCGAACDQGPGSCGLPGWEGEIVANDHDGEWGGFPACRDCHLAHANGSGRFVGLGPWPMFSAQ